MQTEPTEKTITLSIRAVIERLEPGRFGPIHCLQCHSELNLCQPDIEIPDVLVGTCKYDSAHGCCASCRSFHLVDLTNSGEAIIMLLPASDVIREAFRDASETEPVL